MPIAFILFVHLLCALHVPASSASAAKNSILAGEALNGDAKLASSNGRYMLGFFHLGGKSPRHSPKHWYLGIWYDKVSQLTPIWVANRDSPVIGHHRMSKLAISEDGNLVIFNQAIKYIVWSTHASITTKNTTVVLLDNGDLVLRDASNSSNILWQSFDYPTDAMLPDAKFGIDKVTGLNRHLVSKKSLIDPAPGRYCKELDPTGAGQIVYKLCNTSIVYWSSGEWNGHYFSSVPEMSRSKIFYYEFVNTSKEEYFQYTSQEKDLIFINLFGISGQHKLLFWHEDKQDWEPIYTLPKDLCDVHATCGPFTVCSSELSACDCLRGFSITSPEDWEQEDRTRGCTRNTPLNCSTTNHSGNATTDKFYSLPGITLPVQASIIGHVRSAGQCEQECLNNCTCVAYSYSSGDICSLWYDDLLNVRIYSDGKKGGWEVLYLRIAAKDVEDWRNSKRQERMVVGAVIAVIVVTLILLSVFAIWSLLKRLGTNKQSPASGSGILTFRYTDLQNATEGFSERIGGGGFGSVFKGILSDSTAIAVKKLDGVYQGEKQFRAEVSSIGTIQHVNLVRLLGFCCERNKRLLVYEHMSNGSLDGYLFHSHDKVLNWSTRYQIALGVARGLAYMHESCRDCIIHCDIKPENILLDASFIPKVGDFGMAKFLGRDFSKVLTTMRGTIGYLAPEWISGVAITSKVDVYSYGMVLIELVTGRRNSSKQSTNDDNITYFPVEVAGKVLEGDVGSLIDGRLCGDAKLDEAERVCKVACWCIQDHESNRPTMGKVVQILEGVVEVATPPMPRLLQAIIRASE